MRRLAVALTVVACAHGPRPIEPSAWRELKSEHFRLRTDLPAEDARQTMVALENVRAALLSVWHRDSGAPIAVVQLADRAEMAEYALPGVEGFATEDAFGDAMMVIHGAQDAAQQTFLKHELAHVTTSAVLVRNPRWVAEGLACYLETLRFDSTTQEATFGEADANRVRFLRSVRVDPRAVMRAARDVERWSAQDQYAFESTAWALVHWLVDTRPEAFDGMVRALATGVGGDAAFARAFPDLDDAAVARGVETWLTAAQPRTRRVPSRAFRGEIALRPLPAGEVYALLADLQRISPGYPRTAERSARMQSLLAMALAEDAGNPLALQLSGAGDAAAAPRLHPDDWRAWMVVAGRDADPAQAVAKAAELAPDHPGVLGRLAWARLRAGDRNGALRYALRAVEIAPARAELLDTLAHIEAADGRCRDATDHEQRAVEALQDGAPPSTVRELRARQAVLEDRCSAVRKPVAAAAPREVQRSP